MGNRCSRSRLFAFYFWRPPFENSALWHGTTGARGACIKGPWQREVPTHARSVNWLRRFSVAPFGWEAPENLGSGKSFRSSNAFCPLFGALRGNCQKNEDTKITSKGSDCIYCPDCINFKGVVGKIKTLWVVVTRGDFMSVSYYSKGGGSSVFADSKVLNHTKKREWEGRFHRGLRESPAKVLDANSFFKKGKWRIERSTCDRLHLHSRGVARLTSSRLHGPQPVPFCTSSSKWLELPERIQGCAFLSESTRNCSYQWRQNSLDWGGAERMGRQEEKDARVFSTLASGPGRARSLLKTRACTRLSFSSLACAKVFVHTCNPPALLENNVAGSEMETVNHFWQLPGKHSLCQTIRTCYGTDSLQLLNGTDIN